MTTGQKQFEFVGHMDRVSSIAYSPDGRRVLTGSEDRKVKLWDASNGQDLMTFGDGANRIRWVAFAGDGQRLAAGTQDGPASEIYIWDARPLEKTRE
jgi:WD40 repeat protein